MSDAPAAHLPVGARLGPWTVGAAANAAPGPSGARVFRAENGQLVAALKVFPREARAAAANEARALAALNHVSLPRLLGAGAEPVPHVACEWVDGLPLHESLAGAGPSSVLPLLAQLLAALAHAHARGLVHGDLRLENVLVEAGGRLVVLDLGLSEQVDAQPAAGVISGTPAYLAPERLAGGPATPSADLHAAGALLIDALQGETALKAVRLGRWDPSSLGSEVPHEVAVLLGDLVQREPDARPSAAESLRRLLPLFPDPLPTWLKHLESDADSRPVATASELAEPPMVGRAAPLAALASLVRATREGRGTFAVISGESGLGKTRLLKELEARASEAGVRVLAGRCREQVPSRHGPYRDALAVLAAEVQRRGAAEASEILGPDARALGFVCPEMLEVPYVKALADPVDVSPDLNKFRVFSAVTDLLRNWSRREPLVLVLDDLQWADDAAIELTYYLQRNVVHGATMLGAHASAALSIVAARQESETASPLLERTLADARRSGAYLEINLQRLGPDEVRELVTGMLPGSPAPRDLLDLVAAEAAGSPGIAAEVVTSLHAEGLLRRLRGAWWFAGATGSASSTLTDMLRRRIDRVDESVRRFLLVAAVAGAEFDPRLVAQAADLAPAELPATIEQLTRARLVVPSGRGRHALAHDHLRELVLGEMEPDERATAHGALGRALEERRDVTGADRSTAVELARHFVAAGESAAALRHLPDAAAEARAAGNSAEALDLLRTQVEISEKLPREERQRRMPEILAARHAAAELLQRQGRYDEASSAFLDLLGACRGHGSTDAEARALVGLGMTANLAGDYAEAREHLTRALELATRSAATRVAVEARVYLIQNAYMQGRFDDGEPHVAAVRAAAHALGDRSLTAEALRQIGLFHHFRGRTDEAVDLYREALRLLTELGDRRTVAATLHNLGMLHNARGEYHVAMDCYERSLPIFREMGLRMETAKCLNNIGNVHLQQGAASEAERFFLEMQSIYRELDDRRSSAENLSNLGEVDVKKGNYPRGRDRHRQALSVHRDLGNRAGVAVAAYQLGWTLLKLGRLDEAAPLIAEALEVDRDLGSSRGLAYDLAASAFLHELRGEDAEALSDCQEAQECARKAGDRYHSTILMNVSARLLSRLGQRDRAHVEARRASVEATSLGAREEEIQALLTLSDVGPKDQARERIERALAIVASVEDPEIAWRTWHRAGIVRAEKSDTPGALAALDNAVECVARVAHRLGDEAAPFLLRRDVAGVLDDFLRQEEKAGSTRLDAILARYHLLATQEQRLHAKQLLATGVGTATDSAELRRLRVFRDVVGAADLSSTNGLLSAFVERLLDLVDAERGLLFLLSGSELVCRVALRRGGGVLATPEREVPRQVLDWVVRERTGLVTEDVATDRRIEYRASVADLRVKSLLAAPLVDAAPSASGAILGVVYVDRRATGTRFSAEARGDFEATCADLGRLLASVRRAEEREDEVRRLRERLAASAPVGLPGVIGASPVMRQLLATARVVAASSESVLITGQSGTGKEVLARALHAESPRRARAFVAVDCGAVPETLIESVLFGHVKGAFTGADRDRAGLFEEAAGGTLFLDEVTNASAHFQARLLRVLQEREVRRIGGRGTIPVDVRIMAATNRDLDAEVREGRFREDLYYRLNVIALHLPPLSERQEDIALLAEHFLRDVSARDDKHLEGFTEDALRALAAYDWPGNVRELSNCVARSAAFCTEGRVGLDRIPEKIRSARARGVPVRLHAESTAARTVGALAAGEDTFWSVVREPLRRREMTKDEARAIVAEALRRTKGSYKAAARLLGLPDADYTRFMDFLRFNDLKLDFRSFRAEAKKEVENHTDSQKK